MSLRDRLRRLLRREPRTREEAIAAIRAHYRALGIPEAHMSDEELIQAILRFAQAVKRAGIPAREAMERMSRNFRRVGYTLEEVKRNMEAFERLRDYIRQARSNVNPVCPIEGIVWHGDTTWAKLKAKDFKDA